MPAPKKKHPKQPLGIRLHPFIIKRLRKEGKYNALIQRLLCEYFGIDLGE